MLEFRASMLHLPTCDSELWLIDTYQHARRYQSDASRMELNSHPESWHIIIPNGSTQVVLKVTSMKSERQSQVYNSFARLLEISSSSATERTAGTCIWTTLLVGGALYTNWGEPARAPHISHIPYIYCSNCTAFENLHQSHFRTQQRSLLEQKWGGSSYPNHPASDGLTLFYLVITLVQSSCACKEIVAVLE